MIIFNQNILFKIKITNIYIKIFSFTNNLIKINANKKLKYLLNNKIMIL